MASNGSQLALFLRVKILHYSRHDSLSHLLPCRNGSKNIVAGTVAENSPRLESLDGTLERMGNEHQGCANKPAQDNAVEN